MTVKEFGTWAMGYYGPYPRGQQEDIAEYLSSLSSPELDELKVQMRSSCPSHIGQVNGYPPDIEGMEKLMPLVRLALKIKANERLEQELAARMLPAPDDQATTVEDMQKLDWSRVLREGLRKADMARREREASGRANTMIPPARGQLATSVG